MKKFLVIVIMSLLLFSNVNAEWSLFSNPKGKGLSFYIDIQSLKKRDGFVYVWTLQDYEKPYIRPNAPQGTLKKIYSVKMYDKLDCTTNGISTIQYIYYSDNMGKGKFEPFQWDKEKWKYHPSGTVMGDFTKVICDHMK